MAHKKSLEALDRNPRDLRKNDQLLGGSLLLLVGGFRQTLPVIPNSIPADELNTCLKTSLLWKFGKRFTLKSNIRVRFFRNETAQHFAHILKHIGESTFSTDSNDEISFTDDFCTQVKTVQELINKIYPGITENYKNHDWLCERAILAAKNNAMHELNSRIQEVIPGPVTEYRSIDTVVDSGYAVNFPIEFLNSLDPPGMTPHSLQLKIGSVIILLSNLDPQKLCNGTRLSMKRLLTNIIEATILTGKEKGQDMFIPRIPLVPTDIPFSFKRLKFPVRLAFALTVNKGKGQLIRRCGVNLESPCFSHGQLYVACSRVGSRKHLFIHAPGGKTKNVVHRQALD
ncbi:hypothetical protein AVEN_215853-1 [Araneus ventricosus]|uniref:ATP-dependent DNA helicase n=1 Tax=Araneus ventricosus TaxID=182803 RepID=A0A4Y2VE30_ARAVE|nr:hypothetical protein AVEN_215853-1 [Araneus ventricosus]